MYGKELILDIHGCNLPVTRAFLRRFLAELCDHINMEAEDLHFWDYEGDQEAYDAAEDHLKGISAVQFIKTSNITIHTIDVQRKVFLNIFSCKEFDFMDAKKFCETWFGGECHSYDVVDRT